MRARARTYTHTHTYIHTAFTKVLHYCRRFVRIGWFDPPVQVRALLSHSWSKFVLRRTSVVSFHQDRYAVTNTAFSLSSTMAGQQLNLGLYNTIALANLLHEAVKVCPMPVHVRIPVYMVPPPPRAVGRPWDPPPPVGDRKSRKVRVRPEVTRRVPFAFAFEASKPVANTQQVMVCAAFAQLHSVTRGSPPRPLHEQGWGGDDRYTKRGGGGVAALPVLERHAGDGLDDLDVKESGQQKP